MQTFLYPLRAQWSELIARPMQHPAALFRTVQTVLDAVKSRGDAAIKEYERQFDKVQLSDLEVSAGERSQGAEQVPELLKQAILIAANTIFTFHAAQRHPLPRVETTEGVVCWQKAVPIEKVGLYVPGGTAPLFSTVLMLGIPAKIAGCKEVILCTPPNAEGNIHPAILYAAEIAGVNRIFKIGGSQAIAAMAYGTESVPKVYKLFGPGNQYVTAAKQLVSLSDVAIDMPAGPSEVEVVADDSANPKFVAADLLSQAEHGADSQVLLVTTSEKLAKAVEVEIEKQVSELPRQEIARQALEHSRIIILKTADEIVELTNLYAPEHLILETTDYKQLAERITNAGSVFMGHYTPESAGDYASGTNHTLPTNGYARAYSGVNLDSFLKKITFQEISQQGIRELGKTIELLAENEQLFAHKHAVTLRMSER
ncbi:MAG: histidinol dehydrogenase [Candidatus Symbiothrix sp.]|jgi:histidinol dehydrogenase|nr:histidinol dehydrogenase [Candidatus Symbiothrix sp.]